MSALELIILAYVLTALWQLPLVAAVCGGIIRTARNCPAAIRHWLWWNAILLSAIAPLGVVFGLYATAHTGRIEPPSAQLPVPAWRFALGTCGVMAAYQSARLLRAALAVRRLRNRASSLPRDHDFRERAVDIRLSPDSMVASGPLLLGVRRPMILIPPFLIEPANAHLLEAALAHEIAHVRRRDMLTSIISELAFIPLAFHPVAWWLQRKLSESRELACDERVACETLNHLEYARCLLEIARNVLPSRTPLRALGITDNRILEQRIRRLVEMPHSAPWRLTKQWTIGVILAVGIGCSLLASTAQSVYLWLSEIPGPTVLTLVSPPPPPPPPLHRRR